uniref:F-box domain-containing protein n=1 Tax=Strongyloides venezuelensis TaxID=75913 RepID=A0A0K0F0Z3_STRVS
MENNCNMMEIFEQIHVCKRILDYLTSTTDLCNLSNCNRFFYITVNRYHFSRSNTAPYQFKKRLCFPIGLSNDSPLNVESLICWDTNYNKFLTFNQKIIQEKVCMDGYMYDDALHVNLRFNCNNDEIEMLNDVGREIALFIDNLSNIYYDATTLRFKELSKSIELLKLFHVVRNLTTKRITKLDIRIWDINFIDDDNNDNIDQYLEEMNFSNGLPNLIDIYFNIQTVQSINIVKKLINFFSQRKNIKCYFSFNNFIGNSRFISFLNIINYALEKNIKISLMECPEMENYFLPWTRQLNTAQLNNIIEINMILCDWSLLPNILRIVSKMRNIKHFAIQFSLFTNDAMINNRRYNFLRRMGMSNIHTNILPKLNNCKNLKKISWAIPPDEMTNDVILNSLNIKANFFIHLLNTLPSTVVSLSIMNIDKFTGNLTSKISLKIPKLEYLHVVGVNVFENGCLEKLRSLNYLRITYSVMPPTIPNWIKVLMTNIVFYDKDNTFSYQPFNRWWCSIYYGGPFYQVEDEKKVVDSIKNSKVYSKYLNTEDRGLVHVFFNTLNYGQNYKKLVGF